MNREPEVLIVGAGVMGVSAAYALALRERRATVIDAGRIGAGCSYGNAGLIVPSHSVPLATPGVIGQGLKWMLNPESPFFIKFRLERTLWSWLIRFGAASRESRVRRAVPVLRDLLQASRALYDEWTSLDGMDCAYEQKGVLYVYRNEHGLDEGRKEARLLEEFGISSNILDEAQVRELVPQLRPGLAGAVQYPDDAHLEPHSFVTGLAQQAQAAGATFYEHTEALGFETEGGRITAVRTTRGDWRPRQVVLATGSWSPGVARELGMNLPIQPAKGYSLTFERPADCPPIPLILAEARIGVTPMGPHLRLAGTLELAGMDFAINRRRVEAIRRAASEHVQGLEDLSLVEIWRGMRPATPDGLPILGRSSKWENLLLAAGHAMIGLSLGPISGEIVARLACGESPMFDLELLRQERFG